MTRPAAAIGQPIVWLVYNSASGSYVDGLADEIASRLSGADLNLARSFDCQSETLPDADMASAAGVETVIVHGGDGPLNAMVSDLIGWEGAVLPLPGGTANLLCHKLFEQCDWEAVLDSFLEGKLASRRLEVVRCGDHIALAEMLAGPAALWADAREEIRQREAAGILAASKDAIIQSAEGPFVYVVDPPIGSDNGYPGIRFTPENGAFRIQGYLQENFLDFLRQGLAILSHDFRQGPHDDLGTSTRVVCRAHDDSRIELMFDGERASVASGAEFLFDTLHVNVLAGKAES